MPHPTLAERNRFLQHSIARLPGSVPYDNFRPINVPGRFDGASLFDCVCALHPHVSPQQWRHWFSLGHILLGDEPVPMDTVVRGGHRYRHLFPATVEPAVDPSIEILYEDEALIAVHKPAPLPVHPCGRFNLNSMTSLLCRVYRPGDLKVVHRLDANTTGVMILARTGDAATGLRRQFENNRIDKKYLALCAGHPDCDRFVCEDPIARQPRRGGTRDTDATGRKARTEFRVLRRRGDGTCLLEANPKTGRTNQIRVHLWALGMPVVGDPAYLPDRGLAASQTLAVDQPPMCLHASQLSLHHPLSEGRLSIVAPDPKWRRNPACDGPGNSAEKFKKASRHEWQASRRCLGNWHLD